MSDDLRVRERWFSERLQTHATVVRWGVLGVPVLVFPSAGGDAEEIARHGPAHPGGAPPGPGPGAPFLRGNPTPAGLGANGGSRSHRRWRRHPLPLVLP